MRPLVAVVLSLIAGLAVAEDWSTAKIGTQKAWDAAYDQAAGARFIPFQLIVPGRWNGERNIDLPAAVDFTDPGGDRWTGPMQDTGAVTGVTCSRRAWARSAMSGADPGSWGKTQENGRKSAIRRRSGGVQVLFSTLFTGIP